MRAILIDAVERAVREVEYDGKLSSAYALLRCELVDVVGLPADHDMFVDDEGLLKNEDDPDAPFFMLRNGWTFAGSGLIVGPCDDEGEVTAASIPVEAVRASVAFASRAQLQQVGAEPKAEMRIFSWPD